MRTTSRIAALAAATALVVSAAPAGAQPSPTPSPSTTPPAAAEQVVPSLEAPSGTRLPSPIAALQRALGLPPERFLGPPGGGAPLAEAAPRWEEEFSDACGGVWLDEAGTGRVGVAPGEAADELRAEVTDAGFTVRDVAQTTAALEARERQV